MHHCYFILQACSDRRVLCCEVWFKQTDGYFILKLQTHIQIIVALFSLTYVGQQQANFQARSWQITLCNLCILRLSLENCHTGRYSCLCVEVEKEELCNYECPPTPRRMQTSPESATKQCVYIHGGWMIQRNNGLWHTGTSVGSPIPSDSQHCFFKAWPWLFSAAWNL